MNCTRIHTSLKTFYRTNTVHITRFRMSLPWRDWLIINVPHLLIIQEQQHLSLKTLQLPCPQDIAKCLVSTFKPLLDQKVISNLMGNKIAGSGVSLPHLQLAFQRNGREALRDVLSEMIDGNVRVTKSKKIIYSVANSCSSKQ